MHIDRYKMKTAMVVVLCCALVVTVGLYAPPASARATDTLIVGTYADATTLDPAQGRNVHDANLAENIFDYLVRRDHQGQIIPHVATDWQVGADGLEWTFSLRDDVTFHNGEPLDANAVKFSLERVLAVNFPSSLSSYWVSLKEIRVDGPYRVTLMLTEPDPLLLTSLPRSLPLVPPKYTQSVNAETFSRQPVGSGPYRLSRWRRGQDITLVANGDYFLGSPAYDQVVFRVIPQEQSRVTALLSGDVHIAGPLAPEQIPLVERNPRAFVSHTPLIYRARIGIRTDVAPFDDPRVRQALNYAVDVDTIIANVLRGHGTRTAGIGTPLEWGYTAIDPYPYDPAKARALLAEAGYSGGFSVTMDVPTGQRTQKPELVAQVIAGFLRDVGIKVTFRTLDWAAFLESSRTRRISPLYVHGWGGSGLFHIDNVLDTLLACEGGSPIHAGYYCNPEVDEFARKARAALALGEEESALQYYAKAQHAAQSDPPWIFLYAQQIAYGVSNNVNWRVAPHEGLWMFEARPNP